MKAVIKLLRHIPVPKVQWRTPDDGQRNCPKHFEFLDKNKFGKISASVGFIKKKFVTMHGHMNVKFIYILSCFQKGLSIRHLPFSRFNKTTAQMRHLTQELTSDVI